jgi:Ca2+-binding RTX toxin-like protein
MARLTFGFAADMSNLDNYGIPAVAAILGDIANDDAFAGAYDSTMIEIITPSGVLTVFGSFNFSSPQALVSSTVNRMLMETSGGAMIADLSGLNIRLSQTLGDLTDEQIFKGADSMTGSSGADTLLGYAGNDTLEGGAGNDDLRGGLGNDVYLFDGAGDLAVELPGQGIDRIEFAGSLSLLGFDNVEGLTLLGSGNFSATGNTLANLLLGNGGDNTLDGGMGNDTLRGGAGNDAYHVDSARDLVVELPGQGSDTVFSQGSYTLPENVENLVFPIGAGQSGFGNGLPNSLTGSAGANTLDGRGGNDTYVGSGGDDVYVISDAGDSVDGSGGDDGTDTVRVSLLGSGYLDISDEPFLENIVLTAKGAADLTGNASNNALTGNVSANRLDGGAGADTMTGLAGNDTYVVDDAGDAIADSAGKDTVESSVSFTLAAGLESLVLTGAGDIDGTGNAMPNVLTGNPGSNVLAGLAGNDTYHVQNPTDSVVEAPNQGIDTVFATLAGGETFALGENVEKLVLLGGANANGTGNALNNTLTGDAGNNVLDGGAGKDIMAGGLGDDTYVVDMLGEKVTEVAGAGTDTVRAALTYKLGNHLENLELAAGAGNIHGTGNAANNALTGNEGDNILSGLAGNDTLAGGTGADRFVFAFALDAATNVDTVADFAPGTDRLVLDDDFFPGVGAVGALDPAAFVSGAGQTGALDASDRLIYDSTAGNLYFDPDGTGVKAAVLFATLAGAPALGAGDFEIVG